MIEFDTTFEQGVEVWHTPVHDHDGDLVPMYQDGEPEDVETPAGVRQWFQCRCGTRVRLETRVMQTVEGKGIE
jgi:hypothetical protein